MDASERVGRGGWRARWARRVAGGLVVGAGLGALLLWGVDAALSRELRAHHRQVRQVAAAVAPSPAAAAQPDWESAGLPPPVLRYLRYAMPGGPQPPVVVELEMAGQFRRPRSQSFSATTARQTASSGVPALMFDATTGIGPGLWARAWDAWIDGRMEMQARVLSVWTVVDERSSPALDQVSLRRWLLESPLWPQALQPGGIVHWEAVGPDRARAVARWRGLEARLLARFAPDGALLSFEAEEDGDLDTPWHGSGEHVARGDYRWVDGVRLPMAFRISRQAAGQRYPFWDGRVTQIQIRRQPARAGVGQSAAVDGQAALNPAPDAADLQRMCGASLVSSGSRPRANPICVCSKAGSLAKAVASGSPLAA
ncbi:DUF6544 family protein [Ideonella sp. BYS139W]|uniref:DUF6544 family protein n=1 Tax=Pseudaquabacterium rugosum TaxID=2984194 RepID=A0ABU9BGY8_9BURK